MTTANDWAKTSEVRCELRPARIGEWGGIGWTDSSWELARGLDVVEDLPLDAWTADLLHAAGAAGNN